MIRRFAIPSLAVFTAACALRPWTPSVSVAYWSQPIPPNADTLLPPASEVIVRWQLAPSNPWSRFTKLTLLSALADYPMPAGMPEITQLDVVRRANEAAMRIAAAGLPANTMWVVDLRGAASVAFGTALSQRARETVSPVLTFNNWPGHNEVIPAEETLAAIVAMRPRLPLETEPAGSPVFLLDAWRLAYRFEVTDDDATDNRYMLNQSDLPDAALLREQGITNLIYVVESLADTEREEDDLHDAMLAYQDAGITLHMIDLEWLREREYREHWNDDLPRWRFRIEPRMTIPHDVDFFARARGGFGGIHSGPSPFRGAWISHYSAHGGG